MPSKHSIKNSLYFIFVFGCILLVHCSEKQGAFSGKKPAVDLSFTITISETGGFTGASDKTVLKSNGQYIVYYILPGSQAEKRSVGSVSVSELQSICQRMLHTLPSDSVAHRGANMNTTVSLATRDTTLTWTWAGIGKNADVPQEMQSWFFDLLDLM